MGGGGVEGGQPLKTHSSIIMIKINNITITPAKKPNRLLIPIMITAFMPSEGP